MAWVDAVIVRDIIAVVFVRGWLKGSEPERINAECMQIIQAQLQAFEVTVTIAVGIHKSFQIKAVNDGVLVPEVFDHIMSAFILYFDFMTPARLVCYVQARFRRWLQIISISRRPRRQ